MWASIICNDARRVCNCKMCSGCKIELFMLVPGREKEEMEDPAICVLGVGKGNGSVTILVGADESGGGSVEEMSSLLLWSVAIT